MDSECVEIGPHRLYHGDCTALVWDSVIPPRAAIIADPPYGMAWDTDTSRFAGRGKNRRRVHGDDHPFDPAPWLAYDKAILWGANHYAARLPVGTTLVWLKRYPAAFGTFLSDAEIAWQKGGHGVYAHLHVSSLRSGQNFPADHPTQKPVGLMAWCIARLGAVETIADPFMGSGTTGVAAARAGIPFVGIEIDREYFDIACERIAAADAQLSLFPPEDRAHG